MSGHRIAGAWTLRRLRSAGAYGAYQAGAAAVLATPAILAAAAVLAAAWAAWMQGAPGAAFANGRVVEFDRQEAGPYEIAFGKIPGSPRVGALFLSIIVTDTASATPVTGADVLVSATGPDAAEVEVGPIAVAPDPDAANYPGYYDTTEPITLDRAGLWLFAVEVDGAAGGKARAEFSVEATEPNPITGIVTLLALAAFAAVVALAIRMYLRERRRRGSSAK